MGIRNSYGVLREGVRKYVNSLLDNLTYMRELREDNENLRDELERSEARLRLSQISLEGTLVELERSKGYRLRVGELEDSVKAKDGLVKHLKHENRKRKLLTLKLMKNYAEFVGAIIENTPLNNYPGALIDRYGRIVYATPSMKKLFYKEDEEVEGRSCLSYFEVDEESRKRFNEFYTNPQLNEVEVISKLRKGEKPKRQGLVFSKISAPELDMKVLKDGLDEIKIPVCTYVTTRRSRAVLKGEVEKVRKKFSKALEDISEKHSINLGDIPKFGRT